MDSDRCFIGYRRMEEDELSLPQMRQMCDVYLRTVVPGMFCGSTTYLNANFLHQYRDVAESALNAFNNAKWRNFKLVKLLKCNSVVTLYCCMTFHAKEDGSDECLLFRAVVNLVDRCNVLLCEIRDGDESKDLGDVSKDLGDVILSVVRPAGQYICLKHEFGECHSTDGPRGGKCDYAAGFTRTKCGCVACSDDKD